MSRDLSVIGRALAAPARASIIAVLMDGSTRPASELATRAGVSAPTASGHLGVLLDAGLLTCVPRGRQRFYEIADAGVASALEQLGQLCPPVPTTGYRQVRSARDLGAARLCYDHLAGVLGVALAESMVAHGWIDPDATVPTPSGVEHLAAHGIDVEALRRGRRPLVRPCPDWTERRPHVAGSVGAAIATHFLGQRWVVRRPTGRGLHVTSAGRRALRTSWGTELPPVPPVGG